MYCPVLVNVKIYWLLPCNRALSLTRHYPVRCLFFFFLRLTFTEHSVPLTVLSTRGTFFFIPSNAPFSEESESLGSRTWRLLRHEGTIEKKLHHLIKSSDYPVE